MSDNNLEDDDEYQARPGHGTPPLELVRSYLAFARRALRPRWYWIAIVIVVGLALTVEALKYAPRTYKCTSILMAMSNPVLDSNNWNALATAPTLITRQENLEALVRDTGLLKTYDARRPPILRLKDNLIQKVFGKWGDDTKRAILVGTLQSKLNVSLETSTNLLISVEWSDPQTAQELVVAAREGFLKGRHADEVSAFEAKMGILNEHAVKMQAEVEQLAAQINQAHAAKLRERKAATRAAAGESVAAAPRYYAPQRPAVDLDFTSQAPEQKAKLEEMKRRLASLEDNRESRLREEQSKLSEMLLRLTPSHPQVVTEQERIALLSQTPSEVAVLRAEIRDAESTIKSREAMAAHGSSTIAGGPTSSGASPSATLPPEIIEALENDSTDPVLSAQISGAVVRYGSLRDEIRAGRMELDTAQVAFEHRYQIIVPAEVPNTPIKPKPLVILGAGVGISLLLALLLPILAELRRGVIVERWQVTQMQLPVLAELRLPPRSAD